MSEDLSFYCKAYQLRDLKRFADFSDELVSGRNGETLDDESVVFIHPDCRVSFDVFKPEAGDAPSPEWVAFCRDVLAFKVPDDLQALEHGADATADN